jgi:hypothetical protein
VESYRWVIKDNGEREPRRYRVSHVDRTGTVKSYPFDQPGQVLESRDEVEAHETARIVAATR